MSSFIAMYLNKDTFAGDDYAQGLLDRFLKEFLDKFATSRMYHYDQVLEHLKESGINRLVRSDIRYEFLYRENPLSVDEMKALLGSVADFTKEWMNDNTDFRKTFTEHYRAEWEGSPLGADGYPVAQYNAMLVKSTLNFIIATFVRNQMYAAYRAALSTYYQKVGQSCYITCILGIEEFGLYNPNPRFEGVDDIEPTKLSTEQPDIAILWKYFHKYRIIEFLERDDGVMVAKYDTRDEFTRTIRHLNELKYKHFGMGAPRRQVLNLKTHQIELSEDLDPNKVTGRWYS